MSASSTRAAMAPTSSMTSTVAPAAPEVPANSARSGHRVHRHYWIAGPNSVKPGRHDFEHSHDGGDVPHTHADTGPACFSGKKRTKRPNGPQADGYRATPREELLFDVVITKSAQLKAVPDGIEVADSLGGMVGARLERGFGLIPVVRYEL